MDSVILYAPGGSGAAAPQMELGTWLMGDPGADYGARGLMQSIQTSNALRDGGFFNYRVAPIRKMAFPLLLKDVPAVTMLQAESLLRAWSGPGAYISVKPETIPTAQSVFFDVVDGRWEPDYDLYENRAGYRKGTLFLDTQPWGYWPTEILLASAASQGFMGEMVVSGASVIGDAPPLAHIQIIPSSASSFIGGNTGGTIRTGVDMVAISLGGHAGFVPFIPPAAFAPQTLAFSGSAGGNNTGTLVGDAFAPASQAIVWRAQASVAGTNNPNWTLAALGGSAIPCALEPSYRGRFRAFAFMKHTPATNAGTTTFSAIIDADRDTLPSSPVALASNNQLATLGGATTSGNQFLTASNAFQMLDMGEITLPPQASGIQSGIRLRLWLNATTSTYYSSTVAFGGLYLLPVDGAAGILTRGGVVPTLNGVHGGLTGNATQAGFEWNTGFREQMFLVSGKNGLAAPGAPPQVIADGKQFYRGGALKLGASQSKLTFITGDRLTDTGAVPQQVYHANVEQSKVSISYRPQFQFLYGI